MEHNTPNIPAESREGTKPESVGKTVNSMPISDENLLLTMSRRYARKIVGEEGNIKTALCSILSRHLPKKFRFNLIILNQSSTGKSYFLNNILTPIKDTDDIIDFTDFSEAFLKRSFSDVDRKIIKIEQLEKKDDKGQLSFHRLKHLMTEGILRFGNVDNDEKGRKQAKVFEVRGFPIFLTTATDSNIDPETENRFLIMELDESEEQTKKIIDYTLSDYSKIYNNSEWQQDVSDLKEIFQELKQSSVMIEDVKIPFADKIEAMLPKNLTIRRDLGKILNLTCVIAFIHYKNRDRLKRIKPEHLLVSMFADTEEIHKSIIIAQAQDLQQAIEIAGNTINQTISKTSHKTVELYARLKKIANEKQQDDQGVTIKDLLEDTNWPENTIRDNLRKLKQFGFIVRDESQREFKYVPLEKEFSKFNLGNVSFTEDDYQRWKDSVLTPDWEFVGCTKKVENKPVLPKGVQNEPVQTRIAFPWEPVSS